MEVEAKEVIEANAVMDANSIGYAIENCREHIRNHRRQASKLLILMMTVIVVFILLQLVVPIMNEINVNYITNQYDNIYSNLFKSSDSKELLKDLNGFSKELITIDKTAMYIAYGIVVLMFGVLASFYRYQLKEIAKFEHYLFGFTRIRIAGYFGDTKYEDTVREALTKDAFNYLDNKDSIPKKKKVESPIEGHPTSDFTTELLNRVLNAIDISVKPKNDNG